MPLFPNHKQPPIKKILIYLAVILVVFLLSALLSPRRDTPARPQHNAAVICNPC